MQFTVELEDNVAKTLQETAAANGESASQYIRTVIEQRFRAQPQASAEERARRIDQALETIRRGNSSSGRNGREWREFIHEGHNR